ncbi:MAG: alpha/beta hydrolase [Gemmatimonadetes bacterium]|nr:alpha/beta hydrolase [Gemmatimonadota bacterium]
MIARTTRCLIGVAVLGVAGCASQPGPSGRREIVARVADLVKNTNPEGIDTLEFVTIGETRQAITIRGRDRTNPILLFVHGGPANPTMPISWAFQRPWEDYFTVVQWDQRGTGKSAFPKADRDRMAGTMTLDRIVEDGLAVVDHLRRRLGQEKVVVMGWSWGTAVGARMAVRAPERVHAFVGLGQTVNAAAERVAYERTLELARKAGNAEAVRELEALAPYPGVRGERLLPGAGVVRKWARAYDGGWYGRKDLALYNALADWAPEYTDADLAAQRDATQWAQPFLLRDLIRRDLVVEAPAYRVPVVFLMGRLDLHTPLEPVEAYFERLSAPSKRLIVFEKSGHFSMFEEPGRLLVTLVEEVLPLTRR